MKLTYQEAYDKIIEAYFKDEIKPYKSKFCFCGTISPDEDWNINGYSLDFDATSFARKYPYSFAEYKRMEIELLGALSNIPCFMHLREFNETYEDFLFEGMCNALEVLKDIHRERGENVDGDCERILVKRDKKTLHYEKSRTLSQKL